MIMSESVCEDEGGVSVRERVRENAKLLNVFVKDSRLTQST